MSASIPSFFNKSDFYGTLLPGYLILIVYFFLYQPDVLFGATANSLNLLWTVVFLVAGPAVGLTVTQIHRIVYWQVWRSWRSGKTGKSIKNNSKDGQKPAAWKADYDYFWVRIKTKHDEPDLNEIDLTEAKYNFDVSAGMGLIVLGAAKLLTSSSFNTWAAILVLAGAILLVGGYYELIAYEAVMEAIRKKLGIKSPGPVGPPPTVRIQ
ncbi:MAG: hypothetical protein LYZ69_07540 [Nitrososphaerales archaeon]|nr:hypothetical protein [Nitrososphaerales archaeon]